MNYKIVRKKETPNIWEFWKDGKLYITIDETRETLTGNGLLTMHINFNKHPIEIDVASDVRIGNEKDKEKRKKTKEEDNYFLQQNKDKNIHISDSSKIMFALMDYIYCKWMLKQ